MAPVAPYKHVLLDPMVISWEPWETVGSQSPPMGWLYQWVSHRILPSSNGMFQCAAHCAYSINNSTLCSVTQH